MKLFNTSLKLFLSSMLCNALILLKQNAFIQNQFLNDFFKKYRFMDFWKWNKIILEKEMPSELCFSQLYILCLPKCFIFHSLHSVQYFEVGSCWTFKELGKNIESPSTPLTVSHPLTSTCTRTIFCSSSATAMDRFILNA